MTPLALQHCQTPEQGLVLLTEGEIQQLLSQVPQWQLATDTDTPRLQREFRLADYYQTLAFVNAIAWIAHQQDHHPELIVNYNRCQVRFSTHTPRGISVNDFICAAHIDQLHDIAV
jgi:4a-hydroxytetrahydrobiopterin dehydratase